MAVWHSRAEPDAGNSIDAARHLVSKQDGAVLFDIEHTEVVLRRKNR
jgi:hypothetical protein